MIDVIGKVVPLSKLMLIWNY